LDNASTTTIEGEQFAKPNMPQIYYLPDERLVDVEEGETILEASRLAGIPHVHVCGGSARCSTCRVLIVEGLEHCAPPNDAELKLTNRLHFNPMLRLACQTQLYGEGKVTVRRLTLDMEDMEIAQGQALGQESLGIVGEEKLIAILFADIRGFTTFAEMLPPYDVIYVLNRYFRQMGAVIDRYGGTINNYMGDGLMALFGVENPDRAAERAVRAGVEMLQAIDKFNDYLEPLYHHRLKIGIGIHYGNVVMGTVGSATSQTMTAIGDAVNFASRIEAANKQMGTAFLISEAAYLLVKEQVMVSQSLHVSIPGKRGKYLLYEVTDISGSFPLENSPEVTALSSFQSIFAWVKRSLTALGAFLRKLFKFR